LSESQLLLECPIVQISPNELVNDHLESVLQVMNEKEQLRQLADYRDPSYEGSAAEFSWLPGYIIKLGIERIEGGEVLRKHALEKKLDLIVIPEQACYHMPESYHRITKLKTLCIAKKIEGSQGNAISLKQAKQLVELVKSTASCLIINVTQDRKF
jgi:hypothetical protein